MKNVLRIKPLLSGWALRYLSVRAPVQKAQDCGLISLFGKASSRPFTSSFKSWTNDDIVIGLAQSGERERLESVLRMKYKLDPLSIIEEAQSLLALHQIEQDFIKFSEPSSYFIPSCNFDILQRENDKQDVSQMVYENILNIANGQAKKRINIPCVAGPAGIGKTTFIHHIMRNDDGGLLWAKYGWRSISVSIDLEHDYGDLIRGCSSLEELNCSLGCCVFHALLIQIDPDKCDHDSFPVWYSKINKSNLDLFNLPLVIHYIKECLFEQNKDDYNYKLLFNVHFDEIQSMQHYEIGIGNEELSKAIIRSLGSNMYDTFKNDRFLYQPYISGTALFDIILESGDYNSKFVYISPLNIQNTRNMIEKNINIKKDIVNNNDNWKEIEFLVAATTGFPRIIEYMINAINKSQQIVNAEDILNIVCYELYKKYLPNLIEYEFVEKMEYIVLGLPISYAQIVDNKWAELQSNGFVYLQLDEYGDYIPIMPYCAVRVLFEHLKMQKIFCANIELNDRINCLLKLKIMDLNQDAISWEDLIASYEVIKNNVHCNILNERGKNINIRKLFKGAAIYTNTNNNNNIDNINITLQPKYIAQLKNRFPHGSRPENVDKTDLKLIPTFAKNLELTNASGFKLLHLNKSIIDDQIPQNINGVNVYGVHMKNGYAAPWYDSAQFAKGYDFNDNKACLVIIGYSNKLQQTDASNEIFDEDKYVYWTKELCKNVDYKNVFCYFATKEATKFKDRIATQKLPQGIDAVVIVTPAEYHTYFSQTLSPFLTLFAERKNKH